MKLYLFDLDGTLVSTGGAGLRALDRAFEELHGLAEAMAGVSPAGKTDPLIVAEVFETKLGRAPRGGETEAVCEAYLRHLPGEMARRDGYRVMAGVREALAGLAERTDALLALGTGNLERGARIKLEPSGLNRYFPFGGFGSDASARPDVLRAAVRRAEARLGKVLAPRDVVVIGDTVLDVQAGKAIGAVTVAVACGHGTREDLASSGPDVLMTDFVDPRPLSDFPSDE